ncbi:MAG: N-6 DNA methylase [Methanobrevibacter sp.]|jgi:type I restriction-modification system DNA methylase subunit|nr:N-6 DNA methylase [Candidatus Methanovirga basalitermitum]
MSIFFSEFNRYRGKSEHGQVFTPDHIASLMSKLLKINLHDKILDPACGSGALLVKAANLNNAN